jgi:hypothetical protein
MITKIPFFDGLLKKEWLVHLYEYLIYIRLERCCILLSQISWHESAAFITQDFNHSQGISHFKNLDYPGSLTTGLALLNCLLI